MVFARNPVRGLGFEPRLTGPEPVVLPLDDPRIVIPPKPAGRAFSTSPAEAQGENHRALPLEYAYSSVDEKDSFELAAVAPAACPDRDLNTGRPPGTSSMIDIGALSPWR